MKFETLRDLYVEQLKDLYDAENRIVKELPKLVEASASTDLKNAFSEHLEQTRGHVMRLEQIFQSMGQEAKGKTCDGMKGILDEGGDMVKEDGPAEVKDAGLITAAQRVEHYEIAAYGTVQSWAQRLNDQNAANLLQQTLDEEKAADKKLTEIAERGVNTGAVHGATMSPSGSSVGMGMPQTAPRQ
jgi:ferritin-like metal-binding protein YciE